MIIELIMSRGLGFYIDGHPPSTDRWGYGGDEMNMTFSIDSKRRYIPFGDLLVSGSKMILGPGDPPSSNDMWFDGEGNDYDGIPRQIVLDTNQGPIKANVTDIVIGMENDPIIHTFGDRPSEPEPPEPEPSPESIAADMDPDNEYAGLEDADEFQQHGNGYDVTLANGATRTIDQTTVYIRAET